MQPAPVPSTMLLRWSLPKLCVKSIPARLVTSSKTGRSSSPRTGITRRSSTPRNNRLNAFTFHLALSRHLRRRSPFPPRRASPADCPTPPPYRSTRRILACHPPSTTTLRRPESASMRLLGRWCPKAYSNSALRGATPTGWSAPFPDRHISLRHSADRSLSLLLGVVRRPVGLSAPLRPDLGPRQNTANSGSGGGNPCIC